MKRTNFGKRFLRGLCRWAGLIGWAMAVGGCGSEPAAEVDPWLEVTPDVVSFGSDGAVYDRLVFAGTVTAVAEQFPDRPEVWGETGRVCYRYYRLVSFGGVQQAVPVETHRELVLERPAR